MLTAMLDAHVANIATANAALAQRGHAPPPR
jgi:hypothetical protein